MPRVFNTSFDTIPAVIPYINIPTQDTISNLVIQNTNKLKVGFAYQGNTDHSNDKYRSIQLEIFKSLFDLKHIEFYNLQISSKDKKLETIIENNANIFDATLYIDDFYDSAIIINKLDIIISIDSALAHFAGALNKKTFLLLPQNVEWRWFEDINYSPWYPSMKLFRQKILGLWIDEIKNIKEELLLESKI
jgi:ADP-heptose:LPS heptosyltransferase